MNNIIACKINPYKGFSPEETFNGLAKSGFKYIELSVSPNCNSGISRFSPIEDIETVKIKLDKLGLIPITLSGHTDIIDSKKEDFINNLKLANYFGSKYFVASVADPNNPIEPTVTDKEVAGKIKEYLPSLEKYDITLVIELHGYHSRGERIIPIIKLVNSDRVKINYDTGNAIYWGKLSINEMINDFKNSIDYIGHIHIKDKLGKQDEWNFPAIGDGDIPFDIIFDELNKKKNSSPLMVEIEFTPKGVKDVKIVDDAVKRSFDYLKRKIS